MPIAKLAASPLVVLLLVLAAFEARAETVNCTAIAVLPAVIIVQGVYCLKGNLQTGMTSGNAIDIQTNNVVLDLNGFKLGALSAGLGTNTFGIYAINRQNITIRNGTIRGFRQAIVLLDSGASQGHLVEDVRADQNTEVGIQVAGSGNIIRNNQVVSTGGTTFFGPVASSYGIYVAGEGPRVLNNDVVNTKGTGFGLGNAIFFTGTVIGGLAVNNRVSSATNGIVFFGTGKYRDNLTFAIAQFTFSGGTDAGNNF
jgi:hypothetical protein